MATRAAYVVVQNCFVYGLAQGSPGSTVHCATCQSTEDTCAGTEHPDNPPCIYVDLHRTPENIGQWQASGKSQPDYCLALLRELYPEFDTASIVDAVNFGSDELAYMPKGFIRATADMLNKQEKSKHGLYYAGEYLAGSHTAAASASGRVTARTIIKHWT